MKLLNTEQSQALARLIIDEEDRVLDAIPKSDERRKLIRVIQENPGITAQELVPLMDGWSDKLTQGGNIPPSLLNALSRLYRLGVVVRWPDAEHSKALYVVGQSPAERQSDDD